MIFRNSSMDTIKVFIEPEEVGQLSCDIFDQSNRAIFEAYLLSFFASKFTRDGKKPLRRSQIIIFCAKEEFWK